MARAARIARKTLEPDVLVALSRLSAGGSTSEDGMLSLASGQGLAGRA